MVFFYFQLIGINISNLGGSGLIQPLSGSSSGLPPVGSLTGTVNGATGLLGETAGEGSGVSGNLLGNAVESVLPAVTYNKAPDRAPVNS